MYSFPTCKQPEQSAKWVLNSPGYDILTHNKQTLFDSSLNKLWTPDLRKGKLLDFLPDVVLNQLRVDSRKLIVVVQEPLDVREHCPNQSLHGWTGSQVFRLRLRFHTLGQLRDAADLQKQSPVSLVEAGLSICQHCGSSFGTTAWFHFSWLSVIRSDPNVGGGVPMFPLLLLWETFFSARGRLSRQRLRCLKTFSSSLLSGIMGLRAKLTQLSLVGKTFLSDTIPVKTAKTAFFTAHLICPSHFILPVYCFLSAYNSAWHCLILNEHDLKTNSLSTQLIAALLIILHQICRNSLCSSSLQHKLRSLVGLRSSDYKNDEHNVDVLLTLQRGAEITIKDVLNIIFLFSSSANYTFLGCWTQKDILSFTLDSMSVFPDFEQKCSWDANRWRALRYSQKQKTGSFHVPTESGIEHRHILQHLSSWYGRWSADQLQQSHILIDVGTVVHIHDLDNDIAQRKCLGYEMNL